MFHTSEILWEKLKTLVKYIDHRKLINKRQYLLKIKKDKKLKKLREKFKTWSNDLTRIIKDFRTRYKNQIKSLI